MKKPKMNKILEKPIFYEHCDMKGSSLSLDVGTYKLTKFMLPKKIAPWRSLDDAASAIGKKVSIYIGINNELRRRYKHG